MIGMVSLMPSWTLLHSTHSRIDRINTGRRIGAAFQIQIEMEHKLRNSTRTGPTGHWVFYPDQQNVNVKRCRILKSRKNVTYAKSIIFPNKSKNDYSQQRAIFALLFPAVTFIFVGKTLSILFFHAHSGTRYFQCSASVRTEHYIMAQLSEDRRSLEMPTDTAKSAECGRRRRAARGGRGKVSRRSWAGGLLRGRGVIYYKIKSKGYLIAKYHILV